MYQERNEDVLVRLFNDELKGSEYAFIHKVVAKRRFMDYFTLEVKDNHLTILKYGTEIINICWSWNEPKIYFTSGLLTMRIIAEKEALEAAFNALELASSAFNKELEKYEL